MVVHTKDNQSTIAITSAYQRQIDSPDLNIHAQNFIKHPRKLELRNQGFPKHSFVLKSERNIKCTAYSSEEVKSMKNLTGQLQLGTLRSSGRGG